jgi:hypothetical protein
MNSVRPLRAGSPVRWLALALLGAGAALAQTSEPWPTVPLPPHAKVEWVGDRMKVNGIPTRLMRFESTVSRSEIVAYYTAHWSGAYPTKPSVRPLGEATLVGQAHGPYYMTVKVSDRPHDASGGFISVSQVLGNRVELSAGGLPLMPGAKILSVVESSDPGKQSRDLVIVQDAGPDSARNYYQAALENAGWHQVQNTPTDPAHPGQTGSLAVFQRDQSELSVSVVQVDGQRGSTLIATLVTKGTGLSPE